MPTLKLSAPGVRSVRLPEGCFTAVTITPSVPSAGQAVGQSGPITSLFAIVGAKSRGAKGTQDFAAGFGKRKRDVMPLPHHLEGLLPSWLPVQRRRSGLNGFELPAAVECTDEGMEAFDGERAAFMAHESPSHNAK